MQPQHEPHVGMIGESVHDRQFGRARIAEQMRDALVLHQRDERRASGDTVGHGVPFPAIVPDAIYPPDGRTVNSLNLVGTIRRDINVRFAAIKVMWDDAPASGTHSAWPPSGRGGRDLF
ncbi:MAG: hypothetical protein Q8O70_10755 [Burkholderiales bacterium]|nr:hypothetical protein [Burkholderiales bacterium]